MDAINLQGITYFSLNEYDKSIESFDKCLRMNEDYTCALFNKGLVLRILGFLKESLECFDKALENPNYCQKVKPYQVINKLDEYYKEYGVNVNRGVYKLSYQATTEYEETRTLTAKFLKVEPLAWSVIGQIFLLSLLIIVIFHYLYQIKFYILCAYLNSFHILILILQSVF